MLIDIVTPFPEMFKGFFTESMMKKAQDKGIVEIRLWDLREYSRDKHRTVDDYPYGGGAGMIMKPEPFFRAVDAIREKQGEKPFRLLFPSPQGMLFNQEMADSMSRESHLIFLCGHYKGVDQRVVEGLQVEEVSIGDYVLTGGELAAAVIVDSVVRLLPGVLGDFDSAEGDSFHQEELDHPHYTRPAEYRGLKVPEVLISGHHARVAEWRKEQRIKRTREKRPDLIRDEDQKSNSTDHD